MNQTNLFAGLPSRSVRLKALAIFLSIFCFLSAPSVRAEYSIARVWNEEVLDAIRIDLPRPPVHARNLFHLSVAMYDVWAAYDATSEGYLFKEKINPLPVNVESARVEAISYAAYRVLRQRYARSVNSNATFVALDNRMNVLGFPTNVTTTVGNNPAAVGNRAAALILAYGLTDGSNESTNYRQTIGYAPVNDPLAVKFPGNTMIDPNRWQPLSLDVSVTQNGIPDPQVWQTFVCPHWGKVKPFALLRESTNDVYEHIGPPPLLFTETEQQFKDEMVDVVRKSSMLDPDDGVMINASPAVFGNNSLGKNDGAGYPVNPATGLPYAPNMVKRADFGRVLAEYWADGPDSETPPGHWNVLANEVTDSMTNKLIAGTEPVESDLEWDVKMYVGLNGATHDAAVSAWNHKGVYDSVRPISAIRWLAGQGQCTSAGLPNYNPHGIPLVSGLVELVTAQSSAPGGRHELLNTNINEIALYCWPGQPADPTNTYSGSQWVRGIAWTTYQKNTFVTPPFAGLISGHSTFSRAAAEFMTAYTGSPYVPGGLGEFVAHAGQYLSFEYGPSAETRIQWATYFDAADLAGISRIWGGIHIDSDDVGGRRAGSRIGQAAYHLARQLYNGSLSPHPLVPTKVSPVDGGLCVTWPAIAGRSYQVESSADGINYSPCSDVIAATDTGGAWTNLSATTSIPFHRVVAVP
jgi:hypothetical protein